MLLLLAFASGWAVGSFVSNSFRQAAALDRQDRNAENRASARQDERGAAASAAAIADRVADRVEDSRRAVQSAQEEIREALARPHPMPPAPAPSAVPAADLPRADTERLRDAINGLVDRANRAAEDAELSGGTAPARDAAPADVAVQR
ncbi:MAG: hypothetical protein K2X76_15295 [Sphingomonas sp.]|nr:hypothetical protein [Sphingomonas sp.]